MPEPPWALAGEVVVALAWRTGLSAPMPAGVRAVPGPVVVMAERWSDSPVGPYLALAVGHPARGGGKLGLTFSTVVVTSPDARAAGRTFWGLPRECGTLRWHADLDGVEVRWEERGLVLRGAVGTRRYPLVVPGSALQARGVDPVVVPSRLRGRAARVRWEVEVPAGDPLGRLAGRRGGFHLAGAQLVLQPAAALVPVRPRWRTAAREIEPGLP